MNDLDHSAKAQQRTYTVKVAQDKAGVRLDRVLADAIGELSRARIQALIADGQVFAGDGPDGPEVSEAKRKAKAGEVYTLIEPPPVAAEPQPQDIALDVIYEDDHVIVVDKPPGLVVHPAAGNLDGTLVNALLAHCKGSLSGIGGVARPGIVHRLDKGTGGLIIAAKNDAAHQSLSGQFAAHTLKRAYYALLWGVPKPLEGDIEGNLGRSPRNRKKMAVLKSGGKTALTHYRVLENYGGLVSLVECQLKTGRTHQIRVHMASIGHSVLGDPLYGGSDKTRARLLPSAALARVESLTHQALYAYKLGFLHEKLGKEIYLEQEIPSFIKEIVCELETV